MHFLSCVFLLLLIAKFVVHVAFLHLSAAFHESLYDFVHFFILAHVLDLLFVGLGNGEASEVEVSVVLDQALTESDIFETEQDLLLFLQGLFILLCVILLFLVPKLKQFPCFECLNLLLLFDEVITGIEPRIELVEGGLVIASSAHIGVPSLHLRKSVLELLLGPHKEHLVCLLMLAEDDQLGNASHVVLDIDDCVYTEV